MRLAGCCRLVAGPLSALPNPTYQGPVVVFGLSREPLRMLAEHILTN